MEQVTVGLLGVGTVGAGVVRLLHDQGDRLARRRQAFRSEMGRGARLEESPRGVPLDGVKVVDDPWAVVNDPAVDVVIETMGGIDPALRVVVDALGAGKDVVTANKALLAEQGPRDLRQAAPVPAGRWPSRRACGGGIPIVQALGVSLAANQVQSLSAIVNGTCNFILTSMTRDGLPYDDALRAGPGARLRRGRPDARRRRHRHRAQAGDSRPARLRGGRARSAKSLAQGSTGSNSPTSVMRRNSATPSSSWRWRKLSDAGLELRVAPDAGEAGNAAGRGARAVQRDPRRGRRRRRHALLWSRGRDDAHGFGGRWRPDRRRRRPRGADARRRLHLWPADAPPPTLTPPTAKSQPLLPAVHDRRPARACSRRSRKCWADMRSASPA